MTPKKFRSLALELPETVEGSHMSHADFRVRGKIFASLGPDEDWGMVKVSPEEQALLVRAEPAVFEPFKGAWGRSGCTRVNLEAAKVAVVRDALFAAWCNTAPSTLVDEHCSD